MNGQDNSSDKTNGRWSKEEHEKFILGLQLYGKNWKKIEALIVTRNGSQIRSHAQKFFLKCSHKKQSGNDESCQNYEPIPSISENQKKSKKWGLNITEFSSPLFWTQISELALNPQFTIWDLIDYPDKDTGISRCPEKYSQYKKEDRVLGNITFQVEASLNEEHSGFSVFSPSQIYP